MNVHFYGSALDFTGGAATYQPGGSPDLKSLISDLGGRFGDSFRDKLLANDSFLILVNGKGIMQTGGFDTKLSPGDKVEILPFIEAG